MEMLWQKVIESLTRPESLILLLWVVTEKYERRKECELFDATIDRMLAQERERGEVLARISGLLQGLLPNYRREAGQ